MEPDLYIGREQTLVKHLILKKYLERFAHIIASRWSTLTYVDCFSGPWNVRSTDLKDSSFSIALTELRKARASLVRHRKTSLRCLFLEKDFEAFSRLREFANGVDDAEVLPLNLELEAAVPLIVDFVKRGGPESFSFIFIDPTGWSGFAMDVIEPLLKVNPGEILINFMTGDIRRFVESPQQQTEQSFFRLFGSSAFKKILQGLSGRDREDALVEEYKKIVRVRGGFKFTCSAIVLHPEFDRIRFHLIYATRHPKGVDVFKDAERFAMQSMENLRDAVRDRKHELDVQPSLLPGMWHSTYFDSLRGRYNAKAKKAVLSLLQDKRRAFYDDVWELALSYPLTWERDVKQWLKSWASEESLEFAGMAKGQRVPRYGQGNVLLWRIDS